MKIIDIRGTRSSIEFILEDKTVVAKGELQTNGFYVYKSTMKNIPAIDEVLLTEREIEEIVTAVLEEQKNKPFKITFLND